MNIIRNLSIGIALLFFANAFSQEKLVDSLQIELKNSKDDIQTAMVLNQLAAAYQDFNPALLKEYAQKDYIRCFK